MPLPFGGALKTSGSASAVGCARIGPRGGLWGGGRPRLSSALLGGGGAAGAGGGGGGGGPAPRSSPPAFGGGWGGGGPWAAWGRRGRFWRLPPGSAGRSSFPSSSRGASEGPPPIPAGPETPPLRW